MALTYIAAGKKEQGIELLNTMLNDDTGPYTPRFSYAWIYGALGDLDKAFYWLEESFKARDYWLSSLRFEKAFDPLRADPRFQGYLDRMNFPE